jgi:GNAT superfamily N-acetyltransferase
MISVRKSTPGDAEFIAKHAYRLLEFDLPSWREGEKEEMTKADIGHLTKALHSADPDISVFIAVDSSGDSCGYIHLVMYTDYYTGESHAHVTDIVVTKEAEGTGVGKLLLQKADEWAREKNARWITLNVFGENNRARQVYEKAGYQLEWIKYLKQLD